MTTTVYIVRHSEKMGSPKNMWEVFDRIQPLSGHGEEKAKALLEMECLRNADAVYCSPFARTLATLRYIMEADGIQPELDEGLKELEFGKMDFGFPGGKPPMMPPSAGPMAPPPKPPKDNFQARQWRERDLAAEGGESINQCCQRMMDTIKKIVRANPGKKVLVGTHGAAISAYLSGILPDVDDSHVRTLTMPTVFRVIYEGEEVVSVERLPLPEGAQ